jgi:hypothetical protein
MTMKPIVQKANGLWTVLRPGSDGFRINISFWVDWAEAVRHAITGKWAGE